jgi:ketopantoate reductase
MQSLVLEKLQFSLTINTLSALLDLSIDRIFNDSKLESFVKKMMDFIQSIATRLDIPIRKYDDFLKLKVTVGHFSSMHHDLKQAKPLEINAIVKAIIDTADILGINNIEPYFMANKFLEIMQLAERNPQAAQLKFYDLLRLPPEPGHIKTCSSKL